MSKNEEQYIKCGDCGEFMRKDAVCCPHCTTSARMLWRHIWPVFGFLSNIVGGIGLGLICRLVLTYIAGRMFLTPYQATFSQVLIMELILTVLYWPVYLILRRKSPTFAVSLLASGIVSLLLIIIFMLNGGMDGAAVNAPDGPE